MIFWLITYLFWINVITFVLIAYDRHNTYYGLRRIPSWIPVFLACIGGFYGYLMAILLFGRDRHLDSKKRGDKPGSSRFPIDESPVPGWGGEPIQGPGLPTPGNNKPLPPDPGNVVGLPPENGGFRIVANEIIVLLDSDKARQDMELFVNKFHQLYPQESLYKVSYYNTTTRMMRLQVPASERQLVMERLESELGSELDFMLTDNFALSEDEIPHTPGFSSADIRQYYEAIQAPAAWDITQGSSDVTVAIVDTYFSLDHPDLDKRWRDPINIVTQTRNVMPPSGVTGSHLNHGTHVAGIAIGGNEGQGASGMAPKCSWIPISVGKPIYTINMLEGVLYAIYKGADVVNLSLGSIFQEDILSLPVNEQMQIADKAGKRLQAVWDYVTKLACERKCVIVWSGGNDNSLIALDASKRSSETIRVSAVDGNCRKADFSNHGNYPEYKVAHSTLSAPGVGILSCIENQQYAKKNGTSMAAPFVTGAVALMKSLDRSLSSSEIISILTETGLKTLPEEHIGPVIQVKDALLSVRKELIHFDDIIKDEQILLGEWEATKHLIMTSNDDEYLDDILLFFNFHSMTNGTLTMRAINSRDVYSAPLHIRVESGQLFIEQTEEAHCSRDGVTPIRIYNYECKADHDGLLLCIVKEKGKELFSFNLRKHKK